MTQLEFHDKFQTDEEMFIWVNEAEDKIAKLEAENETLKQINLQKNCEECYKKVSVALNMSNPKNQNTCKTCKYFLPDDGLSCGHDDVVDFDTPAYIQFSGCGLHQPIPQQPESKDDPAI